MKFNKLKKHQRVVAGVIILIAIGLLALAATISEQGQETNSVSNSNKPAVAPDYQTIVPVNKSINKLGGWRRVSPPKGDPVFAYSDKIGDVRIDVSEQPLPDSFKSDPDGKVADLARSYAANDKILTGDTTMYVGTSVKGPQSAILTKFNLLILIKSQKKIDSKDWSKYADSLNSINDSNAPKF